MKAPAPSTRGKSAPGATARKTPAPDAPLHRHYEAATAYLSQHFPQIDAWLAEHEPELWRQIREEDEELFRLRHLGASESRYQGKLEVFVSLCELAERLYYDAQPHELGLPALAPDEGVAVYYQLADGSLHRVRGEDGQD